MNYEFNQHSFFYDINSTCVNSSMTFIRKKKKYAEYSVIYYENDPIIRIAYTRNALKLSAYCHGVDPKKSDFHFKFFISLPTRKNKTELNSIRQQN